jgi:sterol desaturase/sphingolipid hydroxylase (fatty acid hydroxylase superfamily)
MGVDIGGRAADIETAFRDAFVELSNRSAWLWLATFVVGAIALRVVRRGPVHHPGATLRDIYLGPSARLDYRWFVVDRIVEVLFLAAAFGLVGRAAWWLSRQYAAIAEPLELPYQLWHVLPIALVSLIAFDLASYLAHRLNHRSAVLWEFHKVHHAADHLNAFTNYREHPVERLVSAAMLILVSAPVDALVIWMYGFRVMPLVLGIPVWFVPYYVLVSFRHSEVWISFGPRVERWLSSPAQHQIHHSLDERHWNRNFATVFSMFDRLGGSLVTTTVTPEPLRFGVPDERELRSVRACYWVPFRRAAGLVRSSAGRRRADVTRGTAGQGSVT